MIRQTEQPPSEAVPEPVFGGYRLDGSPRRREAGSLLYTATAPDGSPAVLQVSAEPVSSRRVRARFRRLARDRAQLDHPSLLGVRSFGEERGRLYVATDPWPARSLAELLRDGALEPNLALTLLAAAASGLDAAHAAGLVHRTFSAESVLLDGERVKLDLFGLFTVAGQAVWGDVVRRDAHVRYDPPEAVRGEELEPASNVYSLTGLLIHAVTGREPYAHHDPAMIAYAHVSQPVPKPSERDPNLSAALDAVVARGMAKDPSERPESAGALIARAALVLRTAPPATPQPVTADPAAPKPTLTPIPTLTLTPTPTPLLPPAPAEEVAAPWAARAPSKPVAHPLPSAPPAPARLPLRARLAPLRSLILVLIVAAGFGALFGMPGTGPEPVAGGAQSREALAVERLDSVRLRLRDDLALAASADDQASVAGRLAMAYGSAADRLSAPELVASAQGASAAYAALEEAARGADEDAYDAARGRVEAAESRISSELGKRNSQPSRK